MKTKIALITFLFLLSINVGSFASFHGSNYCEFKGILADIPGRTRLEEFNMLLEPVGNPNFDSMSSIVGALTVAPIEDLVNPKCNVSEYTKDLLEFYRNNKSELAAKHPDIVKALDFIQSRFKNV